MIHCPHCDISFSPAYSTCPRCKNFATPQQERSAFVARNAGERIWQGVDSALVREELVQSGLSHFEADEIVQTAVRRVRNETRGDGFRRLAAGIPILLFSGLVFLVICIGLYPKVVIWVFVVTLGTGLWAPLSGLFALLTGREP